MSEAVKDRAKDFVAEAVEKTKGAVNDGLDAARERFDSAADGVDARVHRVAGDVRQRAERASEMAREKYRVAADAAREGYVKVKTDIKRVSNDVNDYVRENPGKSLLMAAGVGFVIGLLVRRGNRDDD